MMIECFGGPWDGRLVPSIGLVLEVVPVASLPVPDVNAQRNGCYIRTSRGYEWEADE